jgi:hypothetical protein
MAPVSLLDQEPLRDPGRFTTEQTTYAIRLLPGPAGNRCSALGVGSPLQPGDL